ncbi:TolC family protein [Sphingobacterium oryzagri]|uniref:TolC family protein n=1 Tax=Sphingobacterium oryzagri TaxID=3025669 RepID=A0ABY7WIQ3_9SPHI|nr:TolC family protein [Sphingobacterium sp. KACC 22765]WDF69481.1 TolC family protein [Sphingobacterium sp. KACC 22765]
MIRYLILLIYNFAYAVCDAQEAKYWTLEDCVNHAIEKNIEIKRQQIEVDIEGAEMRIAKNDRLPSVYGYSNAYAVFGRSQDIFGTIQRNDNLNSNMGVTTEIMLYNFGLLKNQVKRSWTKKQLAALEKNIMERELTIRVVQTYLEVLLKQSILQTQDSSVAYAESLHARAQRTTQVGSTSQSELYEAKATLARAQQDRTTANVEVERSKLALAQLMLLEDHTTLLVSSDAINHAFKLPDLLSAEDAYSASYNIHPLLKQINRALDLNQIERQIVKAEWYPHITGSATFGSTFFNRFASQEVSNFFVQTVENFAQQVAVTASFPIFNKGQTKQRLKKLDLSQASLRLDEELHKRDIRQEIQKILFDFRSNQIQYSNAQTVLKNTEKAMEFAKKSYEAGRSSIYEYNDSRNNFIKAQNALLEARYSAVFSYRMLLYQTTGDYQYQ